MVPRKKRTHVEMDDAEEIRQDIIVLRTLADAIRDQPERRATLRACESLIQEREERLAQVERALLD